MANVDATTPHMKIEKAWTDAHTSRNLDAIRPILSNNFVVKIFPKADGHPDLTKEEYIQRYSAAFALFSKVEVRTRYHGTAFKLLAHTHNPQVTSHEVIEAPGKLVNRVCHSLLRHFLVIIRNHYAGHHLVHDPRWYHRRLRFSQHHLFC